jgi:hypothetical protein
LVAILSLIAVGFLSTSRVESIATRNFTRQNVAIALAERATQQAIAQIQSGFTTNSTGTSIFVTQPGAIHSFVFSSGAIQSNSTQHLFSGSGNSTTNGTVNLNYLLNPTGNLSLTNNATNNRWTISGNVSERIIVPLENVTNGGLVVGRIAFFVDDEGTKLNVNSATGNRMAMNVASRPLDISAMVSAAQATSFATTISNSFAENNIRNWNHFFRPEQVRAAISGFNSGEFPFISAIPINSNSTVNMPHLLTPWGTEKLHVNELPTTSVGVNRTFSAITGISSVGNTTVDLANGRALTDIFGGNFSTKYTGFGARQIAANLLQMRFPSTSTVPQSFSYNGPLLGADNLDSNGIPMEHLGYAPYPVINEVGFSTVLGLEDGNGTSSNWTLKFNIQPTIELFNPYPYSFSPSGGTTPRIVVRIQSLSFDMDGVNYSIPTNLPPSFMSPRITLNPGNGPLDNSGNYIGINASSDIVPSIPAGGKVQIRLGYNDPGLSATMDLPKATAFNLPSIGNVTIQIEYVKLIANSANNSTSDEASNSIRDWVTGDEIGRLRSQFFTNLTLPLPLSNATSAAPDLVQRSPPTFSAQRIYHLAKKPSGVAITAPLRYWSSTDPSLPGTFTENASTWLNPASTGVGAQAQQSTADANNSAFAFPGNTSTTTIPGDPSLENSISNAIYANSTSTSDMREPFLATGNYSSPADLGLVPTSNRWRRLRMQVQPGSEGTLTPDWAMLEAISFGNSTNPNSAFNRMLPVNINGRFHLPTGVPNAAPPAPRTIGIRSLAQVISASANTTIQDTMNPTISVSMDATRFKGATANTTTIANAIGNMTWSSNSTWSARRTARGFPANQYILPSEIMEISGVADAISSSNYTNNSPHFKRNEGRASALIPAVTTRSSFFMIYAYAQALDRQGNIDSEALTKTLVEVEINSPATASSPAQYKVKKLYTQPIPLGQ